jgi:WD40-like Beta Propeller Repeat
MTARGGTLVAHVVGMRIATGFLGMLAGLVLVHCAEPNLSSDDDVTLPERPADGVPVAPVKNDAPPAPPAQTPPVTTPPAVPAALCDLTKPFLAPTALAGLATDEATPRLSRDELVVYFTTHQGDKARIARASRPSLAAPFGAPAFIDVQSSSAKDNDPSISPDGSTLWFSSERLGGSDRLFMATLIAGTTTFGPPAAVSLMSNGADDQHPYYRATGGGELWFSSTRGGQWDLYVAKKSGVGFAAPTRIDELHTSAASRQPMITEDGLTLLFASERVGGLGMRDLWIARRPSVTTPFAAPEAVAAVNSPADEFAGWLSPDGCRIYFSSDREVAKVHRLYVAARPTHP